MKNIKWILKYSNVQQIMIKQQKLMYSKETQDKIKLAKQYIQNKYQNIIVQEFKNKQNWNKILALTNTNAYAHNPNHPKPNNNLDKIHEKIVQSKNIYNRMQRQKDSLKNYRLYNIIGRGAFGEVRLAKNISSNEIVAIKRLQKSHLISKKQIYNAYLQKDFMSKNKSPFIVQMKSTFQDQDYLYIAMEYVQGGDLLHLLIQKDIFTQEQTRFYIAELVLAVQEIHKMNYIHRDIKPDNILIDKNGHIKISDFGLSKYLEQQTLKDYNKSTRDKQNVKNKENTVRLSKIQKVKKLSHIKNKQKIFSKVGTPDYISPQVLTDKIYSHSVDIWGIGVIMFQCIFGYPPFNDQDSKKVCHKVANWIEFLQFPDYIQVSVQAKMLILGLITDKSKRLTIKQIKKHPFFAGINWQSLHKVKAPFIPKTKSQIDSSNFDSYQIAKPWTQEEKQLVLNLRPQSKSQKNIENVTQTDQFTDSYYQNENSNQNTHRNTNGRDNRSHQKQKKQRKTVGPKFRFAGFDYMKIGSDPLQQVTRQLVRKSCSVKKIKKKTITNKYESIKTQYNEQSSSKNLKNAKARASNNYTNVSNNNVKKSRQLLKSKISQFKKKSTEKTRPSQIQRQSCTGNKANNSMSIGRFSTAKQIQRLNTIDESSPSHMENIHNNCDILQECLSPKSKKLLFKSNIEKMKQLYTAFTNKIKDKNMSKHKEKTKEKEKNKERKEQQSLGSNHQNASSSANKQSEYYHLA